MGIDSTKTIIKRLSLMSSVLAGMTPPFPALDVLRQDVAAAQKWLQETEERLDSLNLMPEPDLKPAASNEEELGDAQKEQLRVSSNATEYR